VLAGIDYTAPIWAAAGMSLAAAGLAFFWLPETVRRERVGGRLPLRGVGQMMRRPGVRRVLAIDFVYWLAFAVFQTTFALFAARRFGFDVPQTGYFFAAFGLLGAIVQGACIQPVVDRLGDKPTFMIGLACAAVGLVAATLAPSVTIFALTLVPLAMGIGLGHPTISSLVSRSARGDEQGRVQGAASALESLGRTLGPVWGSASLQRFGEATPYLSAAVFILVTMFLSAGYTVTDSDSTLA
jgi:predicted MFS family arabinose efflux permease